MTQIAERSGAATRTDSSMSSRARRLTLVAMLLAVAMTFIDQTIVAIASPTIQSKLALTTDGSQWVVNAYLLALAAVFAVGGRLADLVGPRRMVTIGITGFAAASALCGATPSGHGAEAWIITFRAVQGACGAIMIPAAIAAVVATFPVRQRGRAMALFFGISGGLTAIGPIAGGVLTRWTWRAIFWINVPIALLALALVLVARLPSGRRDGRLDIRGAVLVAGGMGLSVLGFEQAQSWGWRSAATWTCIAAGLAVLVIFAAIEHRTRDPLIQLRIFHDRTFLIDNGVLFCAMVAFVPVFFFASVYSQVSLGYDANSAGLYLLVIFAGFAPASQWGGRMLDRTGARRPLVMGSALACTGFALWANSVHHLSLAHQWPFILMAGAGIGLLVGPASTDAVNRAFDASYGEVTGITQTVRNYASSLGLAVLGTVLSTTMTRHLATSLQLRGVPGARAHAIAEQAGRGGPATTGPGDRRIHALVAHDFAVATQDVLAGMAIALFLCFLIATRYPRAARRPGGRAAS